MLTEIAFALFVILVFLSGMLLASFSMEATLLLGSLAIACSFQLWPSLLGATWLPWITRGGASAGLGIGLIAVILTEPIGQKLTKVKTTKVPNKQEVQIHSKKKNRTNELKNSKAKNQPVHQFCLPFLEQVLRELLLSSHYALALFSEPLILFHSPE